MKTNTPVRTLIETKHSIKALPEVIVDWNMNRYVSVTAENTPSELTSAYEPELFPIESIVEPNRPPKGINKARVGSATIGDDYDAGNANFVGKSTPNGRFYIADEDDLYKYWTSQSASDPSTGALTNCKPQIVYDSAVAVNKITIKLENSWASPSTFNIQTTTVASPTNGDWTTVATEATTPAGWKGTGVINLYWNGTNWTNSARSDNTDKSPKTTSIRGVRMVVTALEGGYQTNQDGSAVASTYAKYVNGVLTTFNTDGKDAFFDLIEISARLEVDLSPYVITVDTTQELTESDNLLPLGTVTSNQGSLTLSNLYYNGSAWVPGLFSSDNTSSPYYNYVDANAKITVNYKYYDESNVLVGTVRDCEMYTEEWAGQDSDEVTVNMMDHSKFFNETTCPAVLWENLTVPEIVWRLMDTIGFNNYNIRKDVDKVTEHVVPVFYTNGEDSVWQVLNDLAKGTQSAIYFDSYNVLQVKTREFAFSSTDSSVWTLLSNNGAHLADIVSADQTTEFEPNHYKVNYSTTNWSDMKRGMPAMQKVWEPEGNTVLRGTPLVRTLSPGDAFVWIGSNDVKVWPYEGIVNVEGEIIKFEGKQFVYYTGPNGGQRNTAVIKSQDEYKSRNSKTPTAYRHKNHLSGGLKITERAVWNSEEKTHKVDALANGTDFSVRHIVNGTRRTDVAGFKHIKEESKVLLFNTKRFKDYRDVLFATNGAAADAAYFYYGTKFKFVKGRPQQVAGMIIHNTNNANEDGYYIEFTPSRKLNGKDRKNKDELILYSRVSGVNKRQGKSALPIVDGLWYEVDVTYELVGSDHRIKVWVNGKLALNQTITGADKNTPNGRFGMFIRGKTKAEFEYLYGIRRSLGTPDDDFSFMDRVERGYTGQQWDREWVWQWKTQQKRVKKPTNDSRFKFNNYYMNEFGPYVHEVREFDVKFDPAPVLHSRLYMTNDWGACALWYKANPFGATFMLANTSRKNQVVNGEDNMAFAGSGATANQVLTVFGRALVIEEAEKVTAKNESQIKRRGKIESEIESPWIQSKTMAKDVANWMNDHFSYGNDQLDVEIFGNPLIEVGDVVHVTYPAKSINADYFVLSARNSFSEGLSTSLTLRRRVA